ncbi:dihydrodipicolinate reductase [Clostridium cavendishii DSM 21758]|uniref:4-hydroxy-tetrahydrodipicolinate reductase n=1 Tax=Clostridium cavendishii DSM 21758 TaxID=1121302 RepID=A0A1M6KYV3_9CLOT|nr:4-hydroxy-tetrahydrodipicolinate reductase [Clostridium cavendishii]SHJ64127.1 dihydrodipicolinate reductase [Clostridium cavendishii DSM 21758]
MVKVILNGCCGKMGTVISNLALKFPNLEIVAGIDKFNNGLTNYPVFEDLNSCNVEYDVLLDFSRADALKSILDFSKTNNKPVVICSTGYTKEDLAIIDETSKSLPLFRSANMSLGINLINMVLRKISPVLYENFDIEIIEKHHNQKVDAPSGTALLLAHGIQDSLNTQTKLVQGRDGISKREKNEIGIHAVRGGSIVGDHDVIFAGEQEIIEINHKAMSRDVFAMGALKACAYMANITAPGIYNMEDVININI